MRFPALDKTLADDELREALSYVYVDKDKTFASDAHIMVIHKTDELFDAEFIKNLGDKEITLHAELIKTIRSNRCHSVELDMTNHLIIIKPKPYEYKKPEIRFAIIGGNCTHPNYKPVLKDAMKGVEIKEISLNPLLLNNLREALGMEIGKGLRMKFNGESHGIYCTANGDSDYPSAEGVIMPVQITV